MAIDEVHTYPVESGGLRVKGLVGGIWVDLTEQYTPGPDPDPGPGPGPTPGPDDWGTYKQNVLANLTGPALGHYTDDLGQTRHAGREHWQSLPLEKVSTAAELAEAIREPNVWVRVDPALGKQTWRIGSTLKPAAGTMVDVVGHDVTVTVENYNSGIQIGTYKAPKPGIPTDLVGIRGFKVGPAHDGVQITGGSDLIWLDHMTVGYCRDGAVDVTNAHGVDRMAVSITNCDLHRTVKVALDGNQTGREPEGVIQIGYLNCWLHRGGIRHPVVSDADVVVARTVIEFYTIAGMDVVGQGRLHAEDVWLHTDKAGIKAAAGVGTYADAYASDGTPRPNKGRFTLGRHKLEGHAWVEDYKNDSAWGGEADLAPRRAWAAEMLALDPLPLTDENRAKIIAGAGWAGAA